MAVRPVVRFPDAVLKTPAAGLEAGESAERLARDLVDTMRASPACVGLAAPQIGVSARAFCVDVQTHPKATNPHGLFVIINPSVVRSIGNSITREGCMSVPDFTGNVRRAERVLLQGLTPSGDPLELECEGFEARAVQHELDHVDGLLFLDRITSPTTDLFRRKRYAR